MRTVVACFALASLMVGCATTATVAESAPTTSDQESERVVVGDMTGLPNDSADLAVGQSILDLQAEIATFVGFLDPPAILTVGDLLDSAAEYRPRIEASLSRMEIMNGTLRTFVGDNDISASQSDLEELTDELEIWIGGQRQQNDPDVVCISTIPASARNQPIEALGENAAYVSCFTAFLESDLVAETFRAAGRLPELLQTVYAQTIEG